MTINDLIAAHHADRAADARRRSTSLDAQTCASNYAQDARRAAQAALAESVEARRIFHETARALADAPPSTLLDRLEEAALASDYISDSRTAVELGHLLGLADEEMDDDGDGAGTACHALAEAIILVARQRAYDSMSEAAAESADDVRDWEASR